MTVGLGLLSCHCVPVSFAFVVLDLVLQPRDWWLEWEERLRIFSGVPRILFRRI